MKNGLSNLIVILILTFGRYKKVPTTQNNPLVGQIFASFSGNIYSLNQYNPYLVLHSSFLYNNSWLAIKLVYVFLMIPVVVHKMGVGSYNSLFYLYIQWIIYSPSTFSWFWNSNSPCFSISFFFAASSLCFLMMANLAKSALASSVLPSAWSFSYLFLASSFSIASLKKNKGKYAHDETVNDTDMFHGLGILPHLCIQKTPIYCIEQKHSFTNLSLLDSSGFSASVVISSAFLSLFFTLFGFSISIPAFPFFASYKKKKNEYA